MQSDRLWRITDSIIGAAIEVHRTLGPGLLESAYETCLAHELGLRGASVERQRRLPIEYKGIALDTAYRLDLIVDGLVLLEIKSLAELAQIHEAQMLTYLRLSQLDVGLLLNFNVRVIRQGIRRYVRPGASVSHSPERRASPGHNP